MANGRCLNHGGKSLSGIASPSYKHGRYSTALPTGLIPRFEASMADPDLLDQRAELALLDARIEELLGLMQANGETARWSDAKAGYQRIQVASHARRPVAAAAALTELGALLDRGVVTSSLAITACSCAARAAWIPSFPIRPPGRSWHHAEPPLKTSRSD